MLNKVVGERGKSLLDLWSLLYFAFGVLVSVDFKDFAIPWVYRVAVLGMLLFSWEIMELLVERWTRFIAHPESWVNRWLGDPIAVGAGVALGRLISYWRVG